MRDYEPLIAAARACPPMTPGQAMAKAVELLWSAFGNNPLSWVGFYHKVEDADEMVLVCREPKPACSPIGLQGVCGRGYLNRTAYVVGDVRTLGNGYIACDPRDASAVVVPMIDQAGKCEGVLDADSYDLNAFDENDARGMTNLLLALNLTAVPAPIQRL